ncbi:hypothetical protein [Polyangium jinanense]|uniref:Uncharacterized protein n=1 Tax=Polyangium jinanense TaxID=2829994 RepID=A0A9X3XJA1_9BACT|nr:hypothetical protein [Polyangium jinanense]MDC3962326.1 hypothetical protein [Polyangium jinanense]MDC3989101.1 hypothetical protein [Polyangium jinanense]
MPSMVLCPSCKRHVFPRETSCPFCGLAISAEPGAPAPALAPELSRAQRYLVGAAIAATVAVAGCNNQPARGPNDVQTEEELERERQKAIDESRDRHPGGGPCVNNVCPPYGCVFPDEACDILRV